MPTLRNSCLLFAVMLAASACNLPRDPEGTLSAVKGDTLLVGVASEKALEAAGERPVLRRLAERLDAELKVVPGELHALVDAVDSGAIHLVAGGIPESSPFSKTIALSSPVGAAAPGETVFGIRKGENAFLLEVERAIASREND